ncbi:hypothetical protein [Sphingobacterium sp. UDSM-2020]|uniref:hypothetical protein n=1 Tax=Sphingobacterium sp. UDSM-2020 TaxID=2795738 RepID=UPI001937F8D1|nr:hypothetical protein [Sphingobacterium sp. UDSM-2020]QQD12003.1 hypothetical protein JAZ75_15375 [Sphingobacterium sp. UDSM-2020]
MMNHWMILFLFLLSFQSKGQQKPIVPEVSIEYRVNDTLEIQVNLIQDQKTSAYFYHTFLATDICNDKVCLPIQVELFWNLMGEYDHFSVPQGQVFTKFDHQYFDQTDYDLLQEILLDTLSPIRDYAVEEFLDKKEQKYSVELDAITRPTLKVFSNVTVPGALYTVYALWHIVNGNIKQLIRNQLDVVYKQHQFADFFATSNNASYQEYYLEKLTGDQVVAAEPILVRLLFSHDDYIPHYAWRKLGAAYYADPERYNNLLKDLEKLKPHLQLVVLRSLSRPNLRTKEILMDKAQSTILLQNQKELIYKLLNYEK